jgi:hypothetical protein
MSSYKIICLQTTVTRKIKPKCSVRPRFHFTTQGIRPPFGGYYAYSILNTVTSEHKQNLGSGFIIHTVDLTRKLKVAMAMDEEAPIWYNTIIRTIS